MTLIADVISKLRSLKKVVSDIYKNSPFRGPFGNQYSCC